MERLNGFSGSFRETVREKAATGRNGAQTRATLAAEGGDIREVDGKTPFGNWIPTFLRPKPAPIIAEAAPVGEVAEINTDQLFTRETRTFGGTTPKPVAASKPPARKITIRRSS